MEASAGWLKDRIRGSLYGGAIGDALGGPVEGWQPETVEQVHGGPVTDLLPYLHNKDPDGEYKSVAPAGRTTDDTHFKNLLCQAIVSKGARVDAEDFARELKPNDSHAYLMMRMALLKLEAFRKPYQARNMGQPHMPLADTAAHHGGRGLPPANGAVMMISPVGLLYPGQPHEAFLAAYEISCAIQQGYAADMAGVVAAGVAAALVPGTNESSVVDAMQSVAPQSAGALLNRTRELAAQSSELEQFRRLYQEELLIHFLDPGETVAVAAGCLLMGEGRFEATTLNAVNFGRDCDSIATVAGALSGALEGMDGIRPAWVETVDAQRGDEPSQDELATGLYEALRAEFETARQWLDRYTPLL